MASTPNKWGTPKSNFAAVSPRRTPKSAKRKLDDGKLHL